VERTGGRSEATPLLLPVHVSQWPWLWFIRFGFSRNSSLRNRHRLKNGQTAVGQAGRTALRDLTPQPREIFLQQPPDAMLGHIVV